MKRRSKDANIQTLIVGILILVVIGFFILTANPATNTSSASKAIELTGGSLGPSGQSTLQAGQTNLQPAATLKPENINNLNL